MLITTYGINGRFQHSFHFADRNREFENNLSTMCSWNTTQSWSNWFCDGLVVRSVALRCSETLNFWRCVFVFHFYLDKVGNHSPNFRMNIHIYFKCELLVFSVNFFPSQFFSLSHEDFHSLSASCCMKISNACYSNKHEGK